MRISNNFSKQNFTAINKITTKNVPSNLRRITQQIVDNVRKSDELQKLTSDGDYNIEVRVENRDNGFSKKQTATVYVNPDIPEDEDVKNDLRHYQYRVDVDGLPLVTPDDFAAKAMAAYFSPKLVQWAQKSKYAIELYTSTRDITPICDYTEFKLNHYKLYELYCKNNK